MMKFTIPVERGNEAAKDGTMERAIESLVKATNAEAAHFTVIDGERAGYIFFEEADQARLTRCNEPMFAALDAAIEIVPPSPTMHPNASAGERNAPIFRCEMPI